jgi:hypothetical protein
LRCIVAQQPSSSSSLASLVAAHICLSNKRQKGHTEKRQSKDAKTCIDKSVQNRRVWNRTGSNDKAVLLRSYTVSKARSGKFGNQQASRY